MKAQIFSLIVLLAGFTLMTACQSDDMPDDNSAKHMLKGVALQIGPCDAPLTRADGYGDDPNAQEGEFINTLSVIITDESGTIKFTDINNTNPGTGYDKGNCLEKRYSIDGLEAGYYDVYAFANFEQVTLTDGGTLLDKIKGLTVGGTLPDGFDEFVVDDPASAVDIEEGKYIPMSIKQQVYLSTSGQSERVEMKRLVCRVDLTFTNTDDHDIKVGNLYFGSVPTTVSLLEENAVTADDATAQDKLIESSNRTIAVGGTKTWSFYVNAKEYDDSSNPLCVKLNLYEDASSDSYEEKKGTTAITQLPRNSILPIVITKGAYTLKLDIEALLAPIGGVPTSIYSASDLLNYIITIPEGCTFTLKPTLYRDDETVDMATTDGWILQAADETSEKLISISPTTAITTGGTFSAIVSATPAQQIVLILHSKTAQNREADYSITLDVQRADNFTFAARHRFPWCRKSGRRLRVNLE